MGLAGFSGSGGSDGDLSRSAERRLVQAPDPGSGPGPGRRREFALGSSARKKTMEVGHMFHLGWQELLVVAFIAFLLIGPKDMPSALRTFVRFTSWARSASAQFHNWMDAFTRDFELDRLKRDIHQDLEPPTGLANLKTNLKTNFLEPGPGKKTAKTPGEAPGDGTGAKAVSAAAETLAETPADEPRVHASVHEVPGDINRDITRDGIQGVVRGPTETHGTAQTEADELKHGLAAPASPASSGSSAFPDFPVSSALVSGGSSDGGSPGSAEAAEPLSAAAPHHEVPRNITRDITRDGIQGVVRGPMETHGTAQTEADELKHELAPASSASSGSPAFPDFPVSSALVSGGSSDGGSPGPAEVAEPLSAAVPIRNEAAEETSASRENSSDVSLDASLPGIKGIKGVKP